MSVVVPFSVAVRRDESVVVLVASGEVDAATVGDLEAALDGVIRDDDCHVVVDAGAITFIDSTGITALVTGMRRLNRARRRLGLACESGSPLAQALHMTGLHQTFDVHATAGEAVIALADAPLLGR